MLDIKTLLYVVLAGFGIISLDAYLSADTVKTEFAVASTYEQAGIKKDFADSVFTREMQEVFSTESLVKRPNVRASRDQSFVTIIANSIGLENATVAFQDLFGMQPVFIDASLSVENDQPKVDVIGAYGAKGTFSLSLPGRPGETAISLIRRSAQESAIKLDPYHAAIYLIRYQKDAGLDRAASVIEDTIAAMPKTPHSDLRARLRNLSGIVALLRNDKAGALATFQQAIEDAPDFAPAHLNLAFTLIERDRFAEAAAEARETLESRRMSMPPVLRAAAHTIAAVGAWGLKDHARAERDFADAVKLHETVTDAYIYWGRMLIEQGEVERGQKKLLQGEENLAAFENYPEIALLYFWMSELESQNAPLARR